MSYLMDIGDRREVSRVEIRSVECGGHECGKEACPFVRQLARHGNEFLRNDVKDSVCLIYLKTRGIVYV